LENVGLGTCNAVQIEPATAALRRGCVKTWSNWSAPERRSPAGLIATFRSQEAREEIGT